MLWSFFKILKINEINDLQVFHVIYRWDVTEAQIEACIIYLIAAVCGTDFFVKEVISIIYNVFTMH